MVNTSFESAARVRRINNAIILGLSGTGLVLALNAPACLAHKACEEAYPGSDTCGVEGPIKASPTNDDEVMRELMAPLAQPAPGR